MLNLPVEVHYGPSQITIAMKKRLNRVTLEAFWHKVRAPFELAEPSNRQP
jgi:hypothetical protein